MESPATGRALFFSALAALLLLGGGCAVGGGDREKASREPRPELAEKAAPLDPALTPTTSAGASTVATTTTSRGATGGRATTTSVAGSAGGGGATTTAAPGNASAPPGTRSLATVEDGTGDSGIGTPAYSDFVAIAFGETHDGRDLQVIVDVAAAFPSPLGEREVIGIGVDVFRTNPSGESDYQLFADGGADGWRAFLQTPDGFVEYPGTFSMGGARLVFQVPWTSVGGRRGFATAAFADWSDAAQTLTRDGQDAAPNLGTRRVDLPGGAA